MQLNWVLLVLVSADSGDMWEEQEDEVEDEDDEEEGLPGQLLSDLIASNKYGLCFTQWMMSANPHELH